ncbi:putative Gpa2-guanine nucleotide-binding protein alpha-2 subunit [Cokeromyces recurvatus]|uniref:putative Gpa2-guanine nucleotide-binding protein alpha-2 subunit n=1 Tax=Cokeromyces recurvatus TaxID=90255 RepID=UPI00221F988E|nr:putative Gpa2-guanine nucleotide-binding protein alpha-2 subunit [Cokeromyces recurvatus]KAI7907112.1 putative Gpa2-guanine nucleotide-binding protein alpha-2 subunit [Cokeromyces recurvatus]
MIVTKNRIIDQQIKADQKRMKKEVKLLLLGAGESGKSTVLKQMRLIHASGFKANEREKFRNIIFVNILSTMQTLLSAIEDLDLQMTDPLLKEYTHLFVEIPSLEENEPFPEIYYKPLKHLWKSENVQIVHRNGHMFAIHDNISYFFEKMDKLWEPNYIPSDQDILRCRAKTTGIVETTFHLGPLTYRMFDVGGQRSERKKWIHCFENVTAILFVVAISGYNQSLAEDKDSVTWMSIPLMLFDTICNANWFVKTSMILLLNKIDIFRKKIAYSNVSDYFPDYQGPANNYDVAKNYFKARFQRLNRRADKRVYVHFTNATDTNLLQHVMMAVSDIILSENLNSVII